MEGSVYTLTLSGLVLMGVLWYLLVTLNNDDRA
jgi:hypothetical protein